MAGPRIASPGRRAHPWYRWAVMLYDRRAFCADTIFHRGLARLGFRAERDGIVWPGLTAAYQQALMASLHPMGPLRFRRATHTRARRLWLTREELLSRYT